MSSGAEERDAKAAAAAATRGMASLEMETGPSEHHGNEEMESLVAETSGSSGMKSRKKSGATGGRGMSSGLFAALMERNQNFSARNLFLLGGLGGLVFLFVKDVGGAASSFERASAEEPDAPQGAPQGGFHASSFGGVNNIGHPAGAKAFLNGEFEDEKFFIPVSNVGHAVHSISPENVLNYMGHYVHDEHRSPYASHLYARNVSLLEQEQKNFEKKMADVRKKWGAWDFRDDYKEKHGEDRSVADFSKAPYKDLPTSDFPEGSWQTDPTYVRNFLSEAKALVTRVKEGIYAEYGQPTVKADGTKLTPEQIAARDKRFAVAYKPGEDRAGKIGWLNPNAWNGLLRKLLHGMMTNDEFYVVMGGHSAAAGHGNNFLQSKMMAFHYLMEPVFDKLGMRLISRNMAQGGVGTTHSAFASGSIYGEKDVLFWDSGMTERNGGAHDVFNKQAILGGERVPILMNSPPVTIMKDSNGTAWIGHSLASQSAAGGMVPFVTMNDSHAATLPFAVRYMFCNRGFEALCKQNKYDAICWEPRTDFEPSKKQADHPGSQVSWHPGVRSHLFAARTMSLIFLHAMDAAIDKWRNITDAGDTPLPDKHWHVGDTYKNIQDKVRTHMATAQEGASACEKLFVGYPRVCRVQMHGFGEWTPRRNPDESMLRSILKPAPNGYIPHVPGPSEYAGINVMSYKQRVPYGQVDVHAIAIATTSPPPELDHKVSDENERRRLARATREAVQYRTKRAYETQERRRRALREAKKSASSSAVRSRALANNGSEAIIPGRGWSAVNLQQHFCDGSYMSECAREKGNGCLFGGHNDARGSYQGDGLSGWLVMTVPKVKEGLILLRGEWWIHPNSNPITKNWKEVNDGKTNEAEPKYVFPDIKPKVNATSGNRVRRLNGIHFGEKVVPDPIDGDSMGYPFGLEGPYGNANEYWGKDSDEEYQRRLKAPPAPQPDDVQFDIAINGKIVKTMKKDEFMSWGKEIVKNFCLWPIMNDVEWAKRDWGDKDGEDVEIAVRIRCANSRACRIGISHVFFA